MRISGAVFGAAIIGKPKTADACYQQVFADLGYAGDWVIFLQREVGHGRHRIPGSPQPDYGVGQVQGMKPEMRVRRMLHGLGSRYRLHRADLPGRPDLVFPARRKVVFVNGCFWHRHDGCSKVRIPAINRDY